MAGIEVAARRPAVLEWAVFAEEQLRRIGPMRFTVGLKLKDRADHTVVEAEDALIAALKVKAQHPDARVTYVRPANRRGDARHPAHRLGERRV